MCSAAHPVVICPEMLLSLISACNFKPLKHQNLAEVQVYSRVRQKVEVDFGYTNLIFQPHTRMY